MFPRCCSGGEEILSQSLPAWNVHAAAADFRTFFPGTFIIGLELGTCRCDSRRDAILFIHLAERRQHGEHGSMPPPTPLPTRRGPRCGFAETPSSLHIVAQRCHLLTIVSLILASSTPRLFSWSSTNCGLADRMQIVVVQLLLVFSIARRLC